VDVELGSTSTPVIVSGSAGGGSAPRASHSCGTGERASRGGSDGAAALAGVDLRVPASVSPRISPAAGLPEGAGGGNAMCPKSAGVVQTCSVVPTLPDSEWPRTRETVANPIAA